MRINENRKIPNTEKRKLKKQKAIEEARKSLNVKQIKIQKL